MQIETRQMSNPEGVTITVSSWGAPYNEGLHKLILAWMKSKKITMTQLRGFLTSFGKPFIIQRGARVVVDGCWYAPLHEILSAMTNINIQLASQMKPKLINLTPHDITIIPTPESEPIVIKPSPPWARVDVSIEDIGHVGGIPLVVPTYGETLNLPEPQPGVFLIVSNIVLAANRNRFDLLTPSRPIRNEQGQVIACGALSVVDPEMEMLAAIGTDSHANALYTMKKANQK